MEDKEFVNIIVRRFLCDLELGILSIKEGKLDNEFDIFTQEDGSRIATISRYTVTLFAANGYPIKVAFMEDSKDLKLLIEKAKKHEASKTLSPKQKEILDKINREYPKYNIFTSRKY